MNTMKKLRLEIGVIVFLLVCLCISSFALAIPGAEAEYTFSTGAFDIEIIGTAPNGQIITAEDGVIAPGQPIEKSFKVLNKGVYGVYYRLYFTNVEGGYKDIMQVEIRNGDTVLYKDLMKNLTKYGIGATDTPIDAMSERELTIIFSLPDNAVMLADGDGRAISFDFNVDAVQADNNSGRDFGDNALEQE